MKQDLIKSVLDLAKELYPHIETKGASMEFIYRRVPIQHRSGGRPALVKTLNKMVKVGILKKRINIYGSAEFSLPKETTNVQSET